MAPKKRIAVVLLIQGDRDLLELTKKCLLLQGGIAIETAMSASEAFKKMETIKPDVIVYDLSYSCETSLDFLKKLNEKRIDIPFISFAYDDEKDLVLKSLDLGANGYVFKSGDASSIYKALKKLIDSNARVENQTGC
jgi:DNA-binding NarL/FixJ family response regulator